MKKLLIFPFLLIGFSGFVFKADNHKISNLANLKPIACSADEIKIKDSRAFDPVRDNPPAVMTRKNIYSLSTAEINSIKTGITAMKALPLTSPTSWQYQAAIHWTTLTNNLPSWKSCQHGTIYFLSWHRMYLYFFERILRAKSGNPNLTLPYWDYQTNPVLHPAYRLNSAANTLFDGSRNVSINGGGSLPSSPMVAINNALANIPFFDFQSDLEGPHGSIHGAIGGNMGSVSTAGLDPCFWLHHSNIDRLWEKWIRQCQGRSNPTNDATWMNHVFTFFDENGSTVTMTGSQVLNTATQLNYRYDLPSTLPCGLVIKWWLWKYKRIELIRYNERTLINRNLMKASFSRSDTTNLMRFVREEKKPLFNFRPDRAPDKLYVELDDVKIQKAPEGVVEVYLNLRSGETPSPTSKSFVGLVDLFTASGHEGMDMKHAVSINASVAAGKLGLKTADLRRAELTFFVRDNNNRAAELKTNEGLTIGGINFVLQKAEQ